MNYPLPGYRMESGQAKAVEPIYHLITSESKDGCAWLMSVNFPNIADHLITQGGTLRIFNQEKKLLFEDIRPYSDGFGGATLTFNLDDGCTCTIQGAWHSNPESFLRATGIDVRNKHLIKLSIVGLDRGVIDGRQHIIDVCFLAVEKIDHFNYTTRIAQEYADRLARPVIYYQQTDGGSQSGPIYPTGTDFKDWEKFDWKKGKVQSL